MPLRKKYLYKWAGASNVNSFQRIKCNITVWHETFAGSDSCDFATFPAIRKNKFPQTKITTTSFPPKRFNPD